MELEHERERRVGDGPQVLGMQVLAPQAAEPQVKELAGGICRYLGGHDLPLERRGFRLGHAGLPELVEALRLRREAVIVC